MTREVTLSEGHEITMPAREYKVACQVASRIGRAASANAIIIQFMERTMAKWKEDDPKAEVLAKYLDAAREAGTPHKFKLRMPVAMCDLIRKAVAHLPPDWTFDRTVEALVQWSMDDMRTTGPLQGRHF